MALSFEELGKKIKAKYPDYSNIDDITLAKKVIQKHPVYSTYVDQGELFKHLPPEITQLEKEPVITEEQIKQSEPAKTSIYDSVKSLFSDNAPFESVYWKTKKGKEELERNQVKEEMDRLKRSYIAKTLAERENEVERMRGTAQAPNPQYPIERAKLDKQIKELGIEPQPSIPERTLRGVISSSGEMVASAGGMASASGKIFNDALERVGIDKFKIIGRALEKSGEVTSGLGERVVKETAVKDPQLYDKIVGAFTSNAVFFIPGIGMAKGIDALLASERIVSALGSGSTAAAKLISGTARAKKIADIAGAGTMAGLETSIDAGQAYNQAIQEGRDKDKAAEIAKRIWFKEFPATIALDKVGFFGDLSNKLPIKLGVNYIAESGQEGAAQAIQNIETGKPVGQGVGESMALALLPTTAMTGAAHYIRPNTIPVNIQQNTRQEVNNTLYKQVETALVDASPELKASIVKVAGTDPLEAISLALPISDRSQIKEFTDFWKMELADMPEANQVATINTMAKSILDNIISPPKPEIQAPSESAIPANNEQIGPKMPQEATKGQEQVNTPIPTENFATSQGQSQNEAKTLNPTEISDFANQNEDILALSRADFVDRLITENDEAGKPLSLQEANDLYDQIQIKLKSAGIKTAEDTIKPVKAIPVQTDVNISAESEGGNIQPVRYDESVRKSLYDNLVSIGRPVKDAENDAMVGSMIVQSEANRRGVTVDDILAEKGLPVIKKGKRAKTTGILAQTGANNDSTLLPEFNNWFEGSKVVDEQGKPLVVYHGTLAHFTRFSSSKMGKTGTSEGKGFYFTDNPARASGYAEGIGGSVMPVFLSIKKPMTLEQRKITSAQVKEIFNELLKTDTNMLSNYGDVEYEGKEKVLKEAIDMVMENETDVDLFADLSNSTGDYEAVARAFVKATGLDGIISEWRQKINISGIEAQKGEKIFIAFLPEQIKSVNNRGTFNPNDPNILNQENSPAFYSKLQNIIEQKMSGPMPAEQLRAMIASSGIKQEELEWYDFDNFLNENPKPTKEQVMEYLRGNELKIQEVRKGGEGGTPTAGFELIRYDNDSIEEPVGEEGDIRLGDVEKFSFPDPTKEGEFISYGEIIEWDNNKWDVYFDQGNKQELDFDSYDSAKSFLERKARSSFEYLKESIGNYNTTKFSQYTLPGGENYREVLFTLPEQVEKGSAVTPEMLKRYDALAEKINRTDEEQEEFRKLLKMRNEDFEKGKGEKEMFRSSHWDEPNVLAHVRLNDRIVNGKRVLFVEEVQSDWHQAGREKGYKTGVPEGLKISQKGKGFAEITDKDGNFVTNISEGTYDGPWDDASILKEAKRRVKESPAQVGFQRDSVPNAPLKKTWHEFVMKRVIRMAAEEGYDAIAWTTGEQQAERYDLSKQVKVIKYDTRDHEVMAWGKDQDSFEDPFLHQKAEIKDLPGIIGKEAAQKIEDKAKSGSRMVDLTGLDLKVGGEGMKGFYDQMLPAFVNKFTKKWGGKVEDMKIASASKEDIKAAGYEPEAGELTEANTPVHSLTITPAMREAALNEGFSLFQNNNEILGQADINNNTITLFKGANETTFVHEFAHTWLERMNDYVNSGKANKAYIDEYSAVRSFLGLNEGQENISVAQHEKFANSFVKWLRTAEAPSEGLKAMFRRFRAWLKNAFATAKEKKAKISPEISDFFSKMMASEKRDAQEFTELTQETSEKEGIYNQEANFSDEVKRGKLDKKAGSKIRLKKPIETEEGIISVGKQVTLISTDKKGVNVIIEYNGKKYHVTADTLVYSREKTKKSYLDLSIEELFPKLNKDGVNDIKARLNRDMTAGMAGYRIGQKRIYLKMSLRISELKQKFEADKKIAKYKADNKLEEAKYKAELRGLLIEYLRENSNFNKSSPFSMSPLDVRIFSKKINNVKTISDATTLMLEIEAKNSEIWKKAMIGDIKTLIKRSLNSPSVDPEYKAEINRLVDGIGFTQNKEKYYVNFETLKSWVDKQNKDNKGQALTSNIFDALDTLQLSNAYEMSEDDITKMRNNLLVIDSLGRSEAFDNKMKLASDVSIIIGRINESETNPLDKSPDKEKNNVNLLNEIDMYLMPVRVTFDIMGKGKGSYSSVLSNEIYGRMVANFDKYLVKSDAWKEPLRKVIDKNKLTSENGIRIGIYGTLQQDNGRQRLEEMGVDIDYADSIKLSPSEMEAYNLMRKNYDDSFPETKETMRLIYGKDVSAVNNYMPFITDWDKMDALEVFERISDQTRSGRRYSVSKGFTKSRVKNAKSPIELEAFNVYFKHMDNVAYFNSMERDLRILNHVINDKSVQSKLGAWGTMYVAKWLDLIARRGGGLATGRIQLLDKIRINIGRAYLGFKLSSMFIQPTSMLDTMAFIGASPMFDAAGKVMSNKEIRTWLINNFPEFKHRVGDDYAFTEMSYDKILDKIGNVSYAGIRIFDGWSAAATILAGYKKNLSDRGIEFDINKPLDKEAENFANDLLRKTQASPFFLHTGLAFTSDVLSGSRSFNRALLQFQTFNINRYTELRYDFLNAVKNKQYKTASAMAFYLGSSFFVEAFGRNYIKALKVIALASLGLADSDDEYNNWAKNQENGICKNALGNALQTLPIAGQIVNGFQYGDIPVPVASALNDIFTGGRDIIKNGADLKNTTRELVNFSSLFGVAGSSEISSILFEIMDAKELLFPFQKEYNKLKKNADNLNDMTSDERSRYMELKSAHYRLLNYNQAFKASYKRGDWERANSIVKKAYNDFEKIK